MAERTGSKAAWIFGLIHVFVGTAILFGSLHPIRDMLDDQAFELCRGMATLQTLNGLGLLILSGHAAYSRPGLLIAGGTTVSAVMAYWIAFTGTHPLDLAVPLGGALVLAGWLWVIATSTKSEPTLR
ncbi:MAG: hypothetical protein ACO25F_11440 [Erythrobacter sp.]